MIGVPEAVAIGAVLIALIFGPRKIPEFARSIGQAKKEYKETKQEAEEIGKEVEQDFEEMKD